MRGASRLPPGLGPLLERLVAEVDVGARLATDPLRFPTRYTDRGDVEVAAAFAAALAFGRVELFGAVVESCLAEADAAGGPAAYAAALAADPTRPAFAGRYYRWLRDHDLRELFAALGRTRARLGSLAAAFPGGDDTPGAALAAGVATLRGALAPHASRALRSAFPHPDDGSACKRWCMFLRWMVRAGAPDLGLWTHLRPAALVIPLDTHVFRIAGFLGLRTRPTPGWRTALQITEALRQLDPADPLRFDFALAHQGISRACLGRRDAGVCPGCVLDPVCQAGA